MSDREMRVKRGERLWGAVAALTLLLALPLGATSRAIPVPPTRPAPRNQPTDGPTPLATGRTLPYDSSVMLVLDDPIGSAISQRNGVARAHLRDALTIGSTVLAPAGSPATIDIIGSQGAKSGDVYGYVDIAIEPLVLSDGSRLPLRAPTSHLTPYVSAGHEATVGLEDAIGDIFIPGHVIFHAMRKGRNVTLGPGTEIRARTVAAVGLTADGAIAVATPPAVSMPSTAPVADFKPMPFATAPVLHPNVKPTVYQATPEPTDTPFVPAATPAASPSAASPSAAPSTTPATR